MMLTRRAVKLGMLPVGRRSVSPFLKRTCVAAPFRLPLSRAYSHMTRNKYVSAQMCSRQFNPPLVGRGMSRERAQAVLAAFKRHASSDGNRGGRGLSDRNKTFLIYLTSVALGVLGLSYAAVPLYQVFCQQTGYGGTTQKETNEEVLAKLRPVQDARPISIYFHTYTGSAMPWEFVPEQNEVVVVPGETALVRPESTSCRMTPVGCQIVNALFLIPTANTTLQSSGILRSTQPN